MCLLSVVQPQNPPPYEAPSQLPPSYEDSLKHSVAINIPGYHVMESQPGMIRGHHLVNGKFFVFYIKINYIIISLTAI